MVADPGPMAICSDELYSQLRLGAPRGQKDIGDLDWDTPPARPACRRGEIHLWRASLQKEAAHVESLQGLLAADERARARRFHFERDRMQFIIARGVLRLILGRYLSIDPQAVQLTYNQYGKPALSYGGGTLSFNVAHSHDVVLYSFTCEWGIGVDVEFTNIAVAVERVAYLFFSSDEVEALLELPAHIQHDAFFRVWTRKEAYCKALGFGLSLAPSQYSVTVRPGDSPALLSTATAAHDEDNWSLFDIRLAGDYVGAVAAPGCIQCILKYTWCTR